MTDEVRAAISVLQNGDDAHAQQVFGEITHMLRREPLVSDLISSSFASAPAFNLLVRIA